jgi:uncharacterized protein YxjI
MVISFDKPGIVATKSNPDSHLDEHLPSANHEPNWTQVSAAQAYSPTRATFTNHGNLMKPVAAEFGQDSSDYGAEEIPMHFTESENILYTHIHDEKLNLSDDDGKNVGSIQRQLFKGTPTFELSDAQGRELGEARTEFFSWGTTNDVYDAENHKIGSFKKEVINSYLDKAMSFGHDNDYEILDGNGNKIGTCDKSGFAAPEFTFRDNAGQVTAKVQRNWINTLGDKWTVDILRPDEIDPRLVAIMPAFKTAADNSKSGS